ncbi:MAG: hypothetical protein OJF59_002835 [Cytophagales bacterium]|jgi:hypothetical protein|nr:MAG: hypothetical protein OJF59_002835 [Cytophagales bacterium]
MTSVKIYNGKADGVYLNDVTGTEKQGLIIIDDF